MPLCEFDSQDSFIFAFLFCQNVDNLFSLYEFISRSKTDPITGVVKNTKYHQL